MTTVNADRGTNDEGAIVLAATAGNETAFATLSRRYRRQLHVHCYRMLGSFEDAEDVVQESFLRAWQKRETFEGRSSYRSWLYRIATNACLDFLAKHERVVLESEAHAAQPGISLPPHIPWLQPYPDRLLEQLAPHDWEPDAKVIAKETIELAFLVALQFLPPKQRAVLILCDVLDWSARETASLLDASVPSVNAALQRARATLRQHEPSRERHRTPRNDLEIGERALLEQYVTATERVDTDALARLLRDDVRSSMPPDPFIVAGRDAVVKSWAEGGFGSPGLNDFKCLVTRANMMPAVACYVRGVGASEYRALAIDVLRIEDGLIAEITTFDLAHWLDAFALPTTLQ